MEFVAGRPEAARGDFARTCDSGRCGTVCEALVNNLSGGNKLDYYLKREIEYAADGCDGETRKSTVTIRLTNTAPDKPLPDYVAGSAALLPEIPIDVPSGTMLTSVRLLATKDAKLVSALANGQRAPAFTGTERGHPSFEVQVAIPPGQSGELSFHLSEPTSPGAPRVPIQPLVDTVTPVIIGARMLGIKPQGRAILGGGSVKVFLPLSPPPFGELWRKSLTGILSANRGVARRSTRGGTISD